MNVKTARWVLVLSSVASLMVALDALVVATALETIRRHLHASLGELEWTVNAYGLSFAVLLLPAAALGDRIGRRRLFAAGLGLFVLGSIACALAPNAGLLIVARAVQGSAAAAVAPMSLALLSTAYAPERRGWAMGVYGGITGIAVLSGPVIGGAVTQGLAWQWVFWINVPIGLAAIPLVLTRIPESYGPRARLDTPGLVLVTAAALGIVWGLVRGNDAGWGSAEVIGALAGGLAALVAFVLVERRVAEPMLPPQMFARRGFSAGTAATFLFSASLYSAVFFMAQFQQISLGQGPLDAGLRLLPWTATLFFVAPVAGALTNRIGARHAGHARALPAGGRDGLGGRDRLARHDVLAHDRADGDRRRRRVDGDARSPVRGHERGGPRTIWARPPARSRRCASSAASSAWPWPRRCSQARGATRRPRPSFTASSRP